MDMGLGKLWELVMDRDYYLIMKNDSLVKKKSNQNHFTRSSLSLMWLIHGLMKKNGEKETSWF